MQINTKYNLDDELWTIDHDEVTPFTVQGIRVVHRYTEKHNIFGWSQTFNELEIKIEYAGEGLDYHSEDKCFKTKEELINSLK